MEILKSFNDACENLDRVKKELHDLQALHAAEMEKLPRPVPRFKKTPEQTAEAAAVLEKIKIYDRHIEIHHIAADFWKRNMRLALFADAWPVIMEILTKYAGKKYGPKTKENICAEAEARAGVRFFIQNYGEYSIWPCGKSYFSIEIYATMQDPALDDENRIMVPAVENLHLANCGNREPIADPIAAAVDLIEKRNAARAAMENLNKLLDEYNNACPDGSYYENKHYLKRA